MIYAYTPILCSALPLKFILVIAISIGFMSYCLGQNSSPLNTNDSFVLNSSSSPRIGPVAGYRGFKNSIAELGFTIAAIGHGIVGYEVSYLNNLKQGDENLSGISMGFYKGFAFFETGINGTIYTNFDQSQFCVRPYIGIGVGGIITLGYGYNFSPGKTHFKEQISPHEFRIIGRIPIEISNN